MGLQLVDEIIYRLPGLDHDHNAPGLFQQAGKFFQAVGAGYILTRRRAVHEIPGLLRRAVIHRYGKSIVGHIQHEVLPHHGQSDESYVMLFHNGS